MFQNVKILGVDVNAIIVAPGPCDPWQNVKSNTMLGDLTLTSAVFMATAANVHIQTCHSFNCKSFFKYYTCCKYALLYELIFIRYFLFLNTFL